MKVLGIAMGAVFAPTRFSSVRISIRDLVADGKSLVSNSGVRGGGQRSDPYVPLQEFRGPWSRSKLFLESLFCRLRKERLLGLGAKRLLPVDKGRGGEQGSRRGSSWRWVQQKCFKTSSLQTLESSWVCLLALKQCTER